MSEPLLPIDLACYRGETPSWDFPIIRGSSPVDLSTGAVVTWYLVADEHDADDDALATKTVDDGLAIPTPSTGVVTGSLTTQQTSGLPSTTMHRMVLVEGTRRTIVAHGRVLLVDA